MRVKSTCKNENKKKVLMIRPSHNLQSRDTTTVIDHLSSHVPSQRGALYPSIFRVLTILNALEYPFHQFRYQTVDSETRDVVMIKPRYDKLTPATRANKDLSTLSAVTTGKV